MQRKLINIAVDFFDSEQKQISQKGKTLANSNFYSLPYPYSTVGCFLFVVLFVCLFVCFFLSLKWQERMI